MKKIVNKTACMLVLISLLISAAGISVSADGTHGFFMNCDASVVSNKADGFMIDFYSDSENAICTYWSNANWSMYTAPSVKKLRYLSIKGGGAYAGLQMLDTPDVRKGIMSLWRYEYYDIVNKETKYVYAKALYGQTTTYDNEGSGTSCVMNFDWKNNQWYRQLLLCWEDVETGYTFIGTWFYDYEADEWHLFAYYNTFLVESYIEGNVGQFLENFSEYSRANYRSFRYRNIYFLSHENGNWVSSPMVKLESDANPKAHGEAKLGVSDDGTYVWASVDGRSEIDTDERLAINKKLVQDETPAYKSPEIIDLKATESNNSVYLKWTMDEHSTPQLSYNITIKDDEGNELKNITATRPHIQNLKVNDIGTDSYTCTVTITDVFGQSTSTTYTSKNYMKNDEQTILPETVESTDVTAENTGVDTEADTDNDSDGNVLSYIIVVGVAAIEVFAAILLARFLRKKLFKKH